MTKQYFRIVHPQAKQSAVNSIESLDYDREMVVTISPPTRSLDQNSKLWPMLTDVSEQVEWYGRKLTPENWKDMFTASLEKQEVVPGIDGDSFVVLGKSTRIMSKAKFADLITLIEMFGADRGVEFKEPRFTKEYDK